MQRKMRTSERPTKGRHLNRYIRTTKAGLGFRELGYSKVAFEHHAFIL